MNQELQLKVQAHLDHELGERESREIAAYIAREPEAGRLCAELGELSRLLKDNELTVKYPETREFYWSQIKRELNRNPQSSAQAARPAYRWWARFVAPALGAAVLGLALLSILRTGSGPGGLNYLQEIDTPLDDTSAISFHSQSAGMTVVWVQNKAF